MKRNFEFIGANGETRTHTKWAVLMVLACGALCFGAGYGVLSVIYRIITNENAVGINYDEIPYWRELHNKITPGIEYDIEFVDDIAMNGNHEYVGATTYGKRVLVEIENDLGKKFNEEYALYYDRDTFVIYEGIRVLAHELVHVADYYDATYSYTEKETEHRAYQHLLEMAGEDTESIYYKVANFMVILNDMRDADSEYKW
ncbi:MAG: hypothetical protein LBQ05_02750 [Christensenellaceae bacterium]|jgi:hypothetical protein|nr:hypothetical protein [Christensenellaceae bacterium]